MGWGGRGRVVVGVVVLWWAWSCCGGRDRVVVGVGVSWCGSVAP